MCKHVESITILKRDGSTEAVTGKNVVFSSGPLMKVAKDDEGAVVFEAGSEFSLVDPVYYQKLSDILNMTGDFSGSFPSDYPLVPPYYVSSVNGQAPVRGNIFLLGSMCGHFGLFESGSTAESAENQLTFTDICAACVDCADYAGTHPYVKAVQDALDFKRDIITLSKDDMLVKYPDYQTSYSGEVDLTRLYLDGVRFWNNLLQRASWRCNAEAEGEEIKMSFQFTNRTCTQVTSGVLFKVALKEEEVSPGAWDAYQPSIFVTDLEGTTLSGQTKLRGGWDSGTIDAAVDDALITTLGDHGLSPGETVTIKYPSETITTVATTPTDKTFTLTGFTGDGTVKWKTPVEVWAKFAALSSEDKVRMHVSLVAGNYVGFSLTGTVKFTNDLEDHGLTSFPTTKEITTNNMVSVDVDTWAVPEDGA